MPRKSGLSEQQYTAVSLLLTGLTQKDVAEAISVDKGTVYRWHNDPHFVAELRQQRLDMHESSIDKLRGLAQQAIDVLAEGLNSEHERVRMRAASKILDTLGFDRIMPPTPAITIEEVELEITHGQAAIESAKLMASLGM